MKQWYLSQDALIEQISGTQPQNSELAFWFIGQCGFILKANNTVIMIDPVLNDICEDGLTCKHYDIPFAPNQLQPDYVLCTHGHIDHMAGPTVSAIAKAFPETRFVIPSGCTELAGEYGIKETMILPMEDGTEIPLGNGIGKICAFSAAHPTHVLDPKDPAMALGYCLELDGIRIVHLGDTYLTPRLLSSLEALGKPDIFLPPINGDDCFRALKNCIGNMEAEEAAKLAVHIGADLTIPTHYDMIQGNTVDPLRFAAQLRTLSDTAKWHIPTLGERILYRKN